MRWIDPFAAFLFLGTVAAAAQDPEPRDAAMPLEDQLALFLEWFPGRYDSALQQRTDDLKDVPNAERNYRRHSIFRRVDLPQFGAIAFYAEQYRDGDPDKVYRQRIYTFTLAPEEDAFRLRVHVPNDTESLRGAYRDPSLLENLQPSDTEVWSGCDLFWRWQGDRFRGELKPGECRFTSEAFGQEIVLEEYLVLGADYIHFADRGLALDGNYLFGMRGDTPNKSLKVRPFECWANDTGSRHFWTHDQGGEFPVHIDGKETKLVLQRLHSPEYLDALRLEVIDTEVGMTFAASSSFDAKSIGLVAPGISVRCTHRPEALYWELR